MYSVLFDTNTGSFYMTPDEAAFHVYSDSSHLDIKRRNATLMDAGTSSISELETKLYNAGFFYGYLDGKEYKLSKKKIAFYDRNPNDVMFAQYLLTNDKKYLELIKKQKLVTLCRIDGEKVFFPTIELESGEKAVLTYTDEDRIPDTLYEKYEGWKKVKMTFHAKCVVNGSFVVSE